MKLIFRVETEDDYFEVEKLTRSAFSREDRKQCDEHYILHKLRKSDSFIKELSLVAIIDERIVAHIAYSKAFVINDIQKCEVILFGPVSVSKNFQNKGIGSKLIRYSLKKAKNMGFEAVIIYGHPNYYPRFGFVEAAKYDIKTEDGKNFPAFMALELKNGALKNISGKFYFDDAFKTKEEEVVRYDCLFK